MPPPQVRLSGLLKASLQSEGYDLEGFAAYFGEWKALGNVGEYSDHYFGKDGFYDRPTRNGMRVLRHVHLPPESDKDALDVWDKQHAQGKRKTSDSILVYAYDAANGYLLLHMVREPHGHSFGDMKTPEAEKMMNQLADVAEEFIYFNTINL